MGRKLSKEVESREVFTTEEAAKLFHVTRVTIHRWLVAGRLKYTKTAGGHRRIPREELQRFAKETGMDVPRQVSGPAQSAPQAVAKTTARGQGKPLARLIIVDDDPTVTKSLKTVLEIHSRGRLAISVEEDGFSSLVRAVDEKPDAIILDGILRGMDGVQACKALKSNPKTKHIVIIAISGLASLEEDFKKAGADAFLLKPFDSKAVVELLEALQVFRTQKAAG